ncbi:hypothetical protein KSP39_PZI009875 [Platanthera zijinensis]|uniref:Uncharacterized protein n=1 Tax=Platanthera zijinensis TaxID=2320716 RepID=A0AAP0BIQ5_9ASPA
MQETYQPKHAAEEDDLLHMHQIKSDVMHLMLEEGKSVNFDKALMRTRKPLPNAISTAENIELVSNTTSTSKASVPSSPPTIQATTQLQTIRTQRRRLEHSHTSPSPRN